MKAQVASLLLLAALVSGLGGCAHEAPPVSYPESAGSGWVVPASYSWAPSAVAASNSGAQPSMRRSTAIGALAPTSGKSSALAAGAIFAKTLGDVPRPRARNELRSVLPGGSDCEARLSEHGVRFRTLAHEIGVKTPILVDGPIANIRYYTGANHPLIADCRLVLALALVGPELVSFGVTDVRFSGAYVYRLSNKGRVSLHAYGLAIDLHGFTRSGIHYEVDHDFKKGLGPSLSEDAPVANVIANRLRTSGLFHEYLTPDDNADHRDHVHVGVSPLPDEVL